ncbi:hypothetical protein NQ317_018479 [Molorchus minor]|uniref:Uncharacterized protein n=1 Tax=Molorchus minor TaxID=1323400 RepID=A0ABQ9J4L3_9CUCU|nr:hypothetical protein NQ317_018479 [Molorchus minor]
MSFSLKSSTKESNSSLDINLQQLYVNEEEDNVVYSIREELIQNVLDEIEKISLQKRIIRFVAECACDALKKVISIHFYHRADIPDLKNPEWAPDEPIEPSPPDTWATKRVPVQPKSKTEVREEETEPRTIETICQCDLGVQCLCYLDAEGRIKDQLELLYAARSRGGLTSTAPSAVVSERRLDLEDLPGEEEYLGEEECLEEQESEKCILKEGFSKIGFIPNAVKLPKIELPPPMVRSSKIEILELPPIRPRHGGTRRGVKTAGFDRDPTVGLKINLAEE